MGKFIKTKPLSYFFKNEVLVSELVAREEVINNPPSNDLTNQMNKSRMEAGSQRLWATFAAYHAVWMMSETKWSKRSAK